MRFFLFNLSPVYISFGIIWTMKRLISPLCLLLYTHVHFSKLGEVQFFFFFLSSYRNLEVTWLRRSTQQWSTPCKKEEKNKTKKPPLPIHSHLFFSSYHLAHLLLFEQNRITLSHRFSFTARGDNNWRNWWVNLSTSLLSFPACCFSALGLLWKQVYIHVAQSDSSFLLINNEYLISLGSEFNTVMFLPLSSCSLENITTSL